MKACRDIQPELWEYLDGEMESARRAEVETHLATCLKCQQELADLRALNAGVSALPKLQPAPQFLAEVRRKIARGDTPEPVAWQDHMFRPFWLKVPLEIAAVIALVFFTTRHEEPSTTAKPGELQLAKSDEDVNGANDGARVAQLEQAPPPARVEVTAESSPSIAQPEPPAGRNDSGVNQKATDAPVDEQRTLADRIGGSDDAASSRGGQSVNGSLGGSSPKQPATPPRSRAVENRRLAVVQSTSQPKLALAPVRTPDSSTAFTRDFGGGQPKVADVVPVASTNLNEVRSRAEQIAARTHGTILVIPSSDADTGDVLYVQVPQEYAAAFKLEIMQNSPATAAVDKAAAVSRVTSGAVIATTSPTSHVNGVLTGGKGPATAELPMAATLGLTNAPHTEPASVVLEILVVPPKN